MSPIEITRVSAHRQRTGIGGDFKGPLATLPEPLQLALFGESCSQSEKNMKSSQSEWATQELMAVGRTNSQMAGRMEGRMVDGII